MICKEAYEKSKEQFRKMASMFNTDIEMSMLSFQQMADIYIDDIRTQQKEEIKKLIDTTMYNVTNELMKQCVEPKDKDGVMLIMNKLNKELKQKIKEM